MFVIMFEPDHGSELFALEACLGEQKRSIAAGVRSLSSARFWVIL